MSFTPAQRLRRKLGEAIPLGGDEGDTLFTDEEIDDLLEQAGEDLTTACALGWEEKAAKLASLVDTAEGNATREMSKLHSQALEMVKHYRGANGTGKRTSSVHKLTRS